MTTIRSLTGALLLIATPALALAQSAGNAVPVTADNFIRAESDLYLGGILKDSGGVGRFLHRRQPADIDKQTVIRLNRDTLYSSAVFDLDAGPVTITMPNAGKRFMSLMIINEDHYAPSVTYDAGPHTLAKVGTRYMAAAVRTLVDPADPKDVAQVVALQDAIKVDQKNTGKFEIPNWDQASQKKVRDALIVLASISVYDAEGYYEKNPYNAYSLNNITAQKNPDGSITIQFGGCDGKIPNCIPIMKGWNYTVRLYRPRPEILSGKWKFPEPQPAG